jgi:hypothetical protein
MFGVRAIVIALGFLSLMVCRPSIMPMPTRFDLGAVTRRRLTDGPRAGAVGG